MIGFFTDVVNVNKITLLFLNIVFSNIMQFKHYGYNGIYAS